MSNIRSKSSAYINSLVGFVLDTKPYHSKLTEVAVEYRFDESMNVKVEDVVASRILKKAGWLYNFTSGGEGGIRSFPAQRIVSPDLISRVPAEANSDMIGVPAVYAKKSTVGYGDVKRTRGTITSNLVRGQDYFHNYGSAEFRVSLPPGNDTDQTMRWQMTNDETVISTMTAATRAAALDTANPNSANRKIRDILLQIQARLVTNPNPAATVSLNSLLTIINTPDLPQSYEQLFADLITGGTPVIAGYTGWVGEDGTPVGSKYVDDALSQLTPPAFFYAFSDARLRETGRVIYQPRLEAPGFAVTNLTAVDGAEPEEWTLEVIELSPLTLSVVGSIHGYIGSVVVGSSFTSWVVEFATESFAGTADIGDSIVATPMTRVVLAPNADQQVWNLIKTDPLAYDRPVFTSTRYGYIQSLSSVVGQVTILDQSIPTGTVVLTATSPTSFTLTSTAEPGYTGTVTVGTDFNDGRLGFRVVNGSTVPFVVGDQFFIHITNPNTQIDELEIYFGYDLDSYDNMTSGYGPGFPSPQPFEFRYDSRFVDYDFDAMNLQSTESVVPGRKFKLTANRDGASINSIKKDGSGPNNAVDLTEPTSGVSPDPALNSVPVLSMPGDSNPAVDLLVYYANSFKLEYSDNNFVTSTFVANVPINTPYTNAALGISFTIPSGSKPFIAVSADDGLANPRVEGGDVFMFSVKNDPAVLDPAPVVFSSSNLPYLLMHGDGFWDAPDASWTISFTGATDYTVEGRYSTGPSTGNLLPGYPKTASLATTGTIVFQNETFKDDYTHFTIKGGAASFASGEKFTFNTFQRKPSILVHGNIDGWMEDAVIGEWYWNGQIGFKIAAAKADLFTGIGAAASRLGPGDGDYGLIEVTRVRPDTPNLVYNFIRLSDGFIVNRSDVGIIGHAPEVGIFKDKYITVDINDPESFTVQVIADELQFWNAPDTVVVRPQITALAMQTGDTLYVRKAEEGRIGLAIDYSQVLVPTSLTPLYPLGIDDDFVDTDTGIGNVPIEKYSPETQIYDGWLPMVAEGSDATNSIAFFPDIASSFTLRSAATDELIGTLSSSGNINEPVRFTFDETFFNEYLKLNTRASLMTYGTFMDEKVRVKIDERVNFLIAGGVLLEDALFNDAVNINLDEETFTTIDITQDGAFSVAVADGPFGTFLPGYGNLPYDAENTLGLDIPSLTAATGRYDTGHPAVDNYLRAQYLSTLVSPSAEELEELTALTALVYPFLQAGGLAATTLPQFLAALDADTFIPTVSPEFGIPTLGMAMDIVRKLSNEAASDETSAASFAVASVMTQSEFTSGFDEIGFDMFGLDAFELAQVQIVARQPAAVDTVRSEIFTPVTSSSIVRVSFQDDSTPSTVDQPDAVSVVIPSVGTITIGLVERIGPRTFQFSLAQPLSAGSEVVFTWT